MLKEGPIFGKAPAFAKALVLALALTGPAMAEEAPRALSPAARNLWLSTLELPLEALKAPARFDLKDWATVGLLGLKIGIVLNNDVPLRQAWMGGRPDLDASMPVFSELGEGWVLASASALAWGLGAAADEPKLQQASAVALQALALGGLGTLAGKYAFGSVRPSSADDYHHFGERDRPYGELSFPSGHAFSAFAAAEAWGHYYGRWWTYPLAALIAYSRVYNNAHWPSDVTAGALLGLATGRLCVGLAQRKGPPTRLWGLSLAPGPGGQVTALLSRHF